MPKNSTLEAARRYGRRWALAVVDAGRIGQLTRLEAFAYTTPPIRGRFDGQPMAPWGHADRLAAATLSGPPSEETSTKFRLRRVRLSAELLAELDATGFLEAFLGEALSVWATVPNRDE